jgi:hypothetical protein
VTFGFVERLGLRWGSSEPRIWLLVLFALWALAVGHAITVNRREARQPGELQLETARKPDRCRDTARAMSEENVSGDAYWLLGSLAIVHVSGEQTEDRFCLVEFLSPPDDMPPLHVHRRDSQTI